MPRPTARILAVVFPMAVLACGSSATDGGLMSGGGESSPGGEGGSAGNGGSAGTGGEGGAAGTGGAGGIAGAGGAGGDDAGSAGSAGSGGAAGDDAGSGGAAGAGGAADAGDSGASGACTNPSDMAVISDPGSDVNGKVGACAQKNFGAEPGTRDCIRSESGLSTACADCYDGMSQCVVKHCIAQCLAGQNSPGCTSCRAQNCDPAFAACVGIPPN